MKRNVDLNDISDGQLYSADSLVKISCNDCAGCEKCCHDMGDSIILDPYDVYMIYKGTGKVFETLLYHEIDLGVVDGIVMPHIKMQEDSRCCSFLQTGRCAIHNYRPGFCRLFPLGRIYHEDGTFDYFNQIYECEYPNKSKIKVKKWLGISNLSKYEAYITNWHNLLKKLEEMSANTDENSFKGISVIFLKEFFIKPYKNEDFFEEFAIRYDEFVGQLHL